MFLEAPFQFEAAKEAPDSRPFVTEPNIATTHAHPRQNEARKKRIALGGIGLYTPPN